MKRFSKVRYNQDKHYLKFNDKESIKSFNLNDIDDLKQLELFLNRVDIGEAQSISDYLKSFEGKRYYIDFDEECYYVMDRTCGIFYLFEMDDVGEAIQAVYLLNKQYDFILNLITFMESKGFTNYDFEKFIEENYLIGNELSYEFIKEIGRKEEMNFLKHLNSIWEI